MLCAVNDCFQQLGKTVFVHLAEIRAVGRAEDGVGDGNTHEFDSACDGLFHADCRKAERVLSVRLILGVGDGCYPGVDGCGCRTCARRRFLGFSKDVGALDTHG